MNSNICRQILNKKRPQRQILNICHVVKMIEKRRPFRMQSFIKSYTIIQKKLFECLT